MPLQSNSDSKRTLYVRRNVLNAVDILDWAKAQGFKQAVPAEELHVTIAFSKEPIDWKTIPDTRAALKLDPESFRVKPLGDAGAVVLMFKSPVLEARWKEICDLGASWDYDGYRPHVTITYEKPEVNLLEVEPYEGSLLLGPEIMEELNEDWTSTLTEEVLKAKVLNVDESLGLVFGWAMVSKVRDEDYFDTQGHHIPEDVMLKGAADFMQHSNIAKDMHEGKQVGSYVFAFPLTTEIKKAMQIECPYSGFMIAMKPDTPELFNKFKSGAYTGFSIGGKGISEEVDDAEA